MLLLFLFLPFQPASTEAEVEPMATLLVYRSTLSFIPTSVNTALNFAAAPLLGGVCTTFAAVIASFGASLQNPRLLWH